MFEANDGLVTKARSRSQGPRVQFSPPSKLQQPPPRTDLYVKPKHDFTPHKHYGWHTATKPRPPQNKTVREGLKRKANSTVQHAACSVGGFGTANGKKTSYKYANCMIRAGCRP